MSKNTVLSWSSGKDSAWALHILKEREGIEVVGLVTTLNQAFQRVAMHAVRLELLERQAEAVGLSLKVIKIPNPCSNEEYDSLMQNYIVDARGENIEYIAFGDLFLDSVRHYREGNLEGTGISPLFPLWGMPTPKLARDMVSGGLRAIITCVDPRYLPSSFLGREFDRSFLSDLPEGVDPCGENGEFHSFAIDAPPFKVPLRVKRGEVVERDGFVYLDVLP